MKSSALVLCELVELFSQVVWVPGKMSDFSFGSPDRRFGNQRSQPSLHLLSLCSYRVELHAQRSCLLCSKDPKKLPPPSTLHLSPHLTRVEQMSPKTSNCSPRLSGPPPQHSSQGSNFCVCPDASYTPSARLAVAPRLKQQRRLESVEAQLSRVGGKKRNCS